VAVGRSYEKYLDPISNEYRFVEVRDNGFRREVALDHHALVEYDGDIEIVINALEENLHRGENITLEDARSIVLEQHMGEYVAALARWDAFGGMTKADALASWKANVANGVDKLMQAASVVKDRK
jgi:hypothetical protein